MTGLKNCKLVLLTAATMLAAGTLSTSLSAQETDARALLQRMSDEIAGLSSFVIQGDAYADARLEAGQIIEHSSQVTLRLRREPASIRITNQDAENTKEIYFDDGSLTVYNSNDNLYAQTDLPGDLGGMLDYAVNQVGIDAPLLDFVSGNIADGLLADADEVQYLETSLIRGAIFHHVGIRTRDVDVQIWVAAEGQPLPGKLVISSKWEGGSPRFVGFFNWDTDPEFPGNLFTFAPPNGAIAVEFLLDQGQ